MQNESLPESELVKLPQAKRGIVAEVVINFVTALTIFFFIYFFIAQTHEVHGASMQPTFYTGDRVVTEKVTKRFHDINRGDIVVLQTAEQVEPLIKRIVGMPGEAIEINDGEVFINGQVLNEPYVVSDVKTYGQQFLPEGKVYSIPEGQYIAMGDNRGVSSDSRSWGTVLENEIIGRVLLRYWPLDKFGFLKDSN